MDNMPGCSQQVGTKVIVNRSMTLIDSLREEGTNLPTQLYRDPPPSILTIVGSAVATIVLDGYVIKWFDMREGKDSDIPDRVQLRKRMP